MTIISILLLLSLLQIKHLIVDWCWQPCYEYLNKGTYGHWGGIRHSLKNAIGTVLCFIPFVIFNMPIALLLLIFILDFLLHYHIDYLKCNINRIKGWTCTNSDNFWRLTGLDQFLHQICYIGLVALFVL